MIDGVVLTFVDITERERIQAERESLAAIVDASRDAVIGYTEDQRISSWNPAAERLFGYTAAQAIGQPLTMLLPNATQIQDLLDVRSQPRLSMEVEMQWRCRDGSCVEVTVTGSFVREPAGAVDSGALIVRDSTQRLLSERHLELMLGELNHRVKNTLASVQAIAQQTLKYSKSPEEFRKVFMERLLSLSRTHNLLAKDVWRGAQLRDLVQAELAPYQVGKRARAQIEGEALELLPKTALALSMAFHELATNAVKYGSLSAPRGRVSVTWQIQEQPGGHSLKLEWIERDGPPVSPSKRRCFGHRLITQGLPLELDCEVDLQFQPAGVECHMQIPLPDAQVNTGK
ncbi:MAG: HWE histidine kinase domain-containing protein [Rhodanobacter sp.]